MGFGLVTEGFARLNIPRLWSAAAAATGVLFAVMLVFAVGVAGSPTASVNPDDTSAAIAAAILENTTNVVTGNYLLLIAAFLLIVFVGYLRSAILPEDGEEWPAFIGFGGGMVTAGVLTIVALIGIAEGQITDYGSDPVVARTLLTLGWNGIWMTTPGLAALTAGMSLLSLTHSTLPRYLGSLGALAAVFLLTPLWGIGFVGALLWISVTSVVLTIRELRTTDD